MTSRQQTANKNMENYSNQNFNYERPYASEQPQNGPQSQGGPQSQYGSRSQGGPMPQYGTQFQTGPRPEGSYGPYHQQTYYRPKPQLTPFDALKKRCTRVGIALLCSVAAMYIFIYWFVFMYTLGIAFGSFSGDSVLYIVFSELISCVGAYVIAPLVMWVILMPLPKARPQKQNVSAETFVKWIFIAFGADIGLSYISNLVLTVFSSIFGGGSVSLTTSTQEPFWLTLLTVVIIAPIVEEIMFRHILFNHLLPDGEMFAVVISAIAFGLFHMNFYQGFYAAALGLLFGLIMIKTGNLYYTIGLHMIINFLGSVESMWLSDLPLISFAYTILLYIIAAIGIVLLVIDIIKKDCTPQAARYQYKTGSFKGAVKSPGMIVCWSVLGAFGLIMTIVMLAVY